MKKITWDTKYNIGNHIIDEQHQYLVHLINLIIENKNKLSKTEIKAIFNKLIHYANIHFHDEEELLAEIEYPNKTEHKLEHKDFIHRLNIIELDIILDDEQTVDDILSFLSEWLINHILVSDKNFAPFVQNNAY